MRIEQNNDHSRIMHKTRSRSSFNPIQDGSFLGCSRIGGQKGPLSLKSVTHILQ